MQSGISFIVAWIAVLLLCLVFTYFLFLSLSVIAMCFVIFILVHFFFTSVFMLQFCLYKKKKKKKKTVCRNEVRSSIDDGSADGRASIPVFGSSVGTLSSCPMSAIADTMATNQPSSLTSSPLIDIEGAAAGARHSFDHHDQASSLIQQRVAPASSKSTRINI